MRIVFLTPGPIRIPSGSYRVIYEHANTLVKTGYHIDIVHVIGLERPVSIFKILKEIYKYLFIRSKPLGWIDIQPEISFKKCFSYRLKYITGKCDAIIGSNYTVSKIVSNLRCRNKFVFLHHDEEIYGNRINLDNFCIKGKNLKYLTVSNGTKTALYNKYGLDSILVPNGVNEIFTYRNKGNRDIDILAIYLDKEIKQPSKMIDLVLKLKNTKNIVLIDRSGSLKMDGVTIIREKLSDGSLSSLYNRAKYFLSTSALEGYAFAQAEALKCGAHIITYDCVGNMDFIDFGMNAINLAEYSEELANVLDTYPLASRALIASKVLGWSEANALLVDEIL